MFAKILAVLLVIVIGVAGFRFVVIHNAINKMQTHSLGAEFGPADAKDVMVEFMDYRCAFCRMIGPDIAEFAARNPDIRIVIRHFPVFNAPSVRDAKFALAAVRQGKFSEAHTALMAREEPASEAEFEALAAQLGLDWEKMKTDMEDEALMNQLYDTVDNAVMLGIDRTPAFLINGKIFLPENRRPTVEEYESLFGRTPADAPASEPAPAAAE